MAVFFVTGGSRGIGEAVVLAAARSGHDVAFTFRTREAEAAAVAERACSVRGGGRFRAYGLDVSDPGQVEAVGERVLADFEAVDVVVSNAGLNRNNLVVSMSDEEWHSVLGVNLTGAFYVARQFLPTFLARRKGRFVFVSSLGATGVSGQANYSASKAGLLGLSAALAKEYGRKGITANVVVPGFFDTDMTRETMPQLNKDYWAKYCPMPKGRMGEISELAGVVNFLASEAGGFVNGEIINVTGGLNWTY